MVEEEETNFKRREEVNLSQTLYKSLILQRVVNTKYLEAFIEREVSNLQSGLRVFWIVSTVTEWIKHVNQDTTVQWTRVYLLFVIGKFIFSFFFTCSPVLAEKLTYLLFCIQGKRNKSFGANWWKSGANELHDANCGASFQRCLLWCHLVAAWCRGTMLMWMGKAWFWRLWCFDDIMWHLGGKKLG